jgi:hypothetical protein
MPALVGRGLGLSLLATYASATSTLRLNNTYPLSIEFATLACVGHLSRLGVGDYYTLGGNGAGSFPASTDVDELWLATLYNQTASDDVDLVTFVTGECRDAVPAVVRFDYETQREFLPQLLTAAIALDAVPLAVGDDLEGLAPLIVLDAVVEWAGLDNRATVECVSCCCCRADHEQPDCDGSLPGANDGRYDDATHPGTCSTRTRTASRATGS